MSLTACLFLLASCTSEQKVYGTVMLPVVKECKDTLIIELKKSEKKKEITWSFDEFTAELSITQYPSLIGVINIKGVNERFDRETIMRNIVNGVILDCYPTSTAEFEITELGEDFKSSIDLLRRGHKSKSEYLTFEEDKIIYHFKGGDFD